MHLKQLKLSGFKSFVDPTVVHFPSQLVAVVGPNGCGKSNIIDAVRWVMGESSAKNLRGESMTDVIFNGSSNRKPVGQASIELIFDNSLGRLLGPFASYGEIAVKRVVTRDGDSSYYLNGSRCRRRDITDIFLGTGAGARGYSIIGQGTISRLIEAKPEELRAFLEEAAGVSKYKERRRETLQRMAQTQENLNRVADIRDELEKQLQRLERQAKAAERYTVLKEEEALCRAEIMALKWRDFYEQQQAKQEELHELVLSHEQQQSLYTHATTQRTVLNEQLYGANEHLQDVQSLFYQLGTEIARLEESIQQQHREQRRLEHDRQQMQEDWQRATEQLKYDKEQLLENQERVAVVQQQLVQLNNARSSEELYWQEAREQQVLCDERWQEMQRQHNSLKSELQVTQLKMQHNEQNRQQLMLRLEQLQRDRSTASVEHLQQQRLELEALQVQHREQHHDAEEQAQIGTKNGQQVRIKLQELEQRLHQAQNDFYRFNSEYAALSAAQKVARLGHRASTEGMEQWSDAPRLMDVLQVDPQWQGACERVLHEELHAYVLDDFNVFWPHAQDCARHGESALTLSKERVAPAVRPRLIDKIHSQAPRSVYCLEHIYAAEDLVQALEWLSELQVHESIITLDGFWLGAGWVKLISHAEHDEIGLLARQQKITELALVVEELQQNTSCLQQERDATYAQLQAALAANDALQLALQNSTESLRASANALSRNEQELHHAQQLIAAVLRQEDEVQHAMEELATEHLALSEHLYLLEHSVYEQEEQYLQCSEEKQQHSTKVSTLQQQLEHTRTLCHQAELDCDRALTKTQQLIDSVQREQERLVVLEERMEQLALLCMNSSAPVLELQKQLEEYLVQHTDVEARLAAGREQLTQLKIRLGDLEKDSFNCEQSVKKIQDCIAQLRLQEQELSVRACAIQESLDESGLKAELLLEHIPLGITQRIREEDLLALIEKIKRLGAINLAAIEEFSTEQQRKIYLDEQHADLSQALQALQTAIDTMDKETRTRLEHTFNEVNNSFKTLFPRLFGGGRAQLELTCDNLLEAGIVVMAQPPGKRNSTIHLLSGGEKAMTAVALVFAIFQLNPSPFCMLDEVDAPLDDINVGRFCALVKEMSQFVQFLFITHNKVTMELADHLIGVTMREPGVSRLVAVDVHEALKL